MIEFRAMAAPVADQDQREFTVPVDSPAARLRIAVRGVGQVAISHMTLTNGIELRRNRNYSVRRILGRRAPGRGLPAIDWARNSQTFEVSTG